MVIFGGIRSGGDVLVGDAEGKSPPVAGRRGWQEEGSPGWTTGGLGSEPAALASIQ